MTQKWLKGVEDVRKRIATGKYKRALNKQMQDDLVSNKEGDRIGKQAPTGRSRDADVNTHTYTRA